MEIHRFWLIRKETRDGNIYEEQQDMYPVWQTEGGGKAETATTTTTTLRQSKGMPFEVFRVRYLKPITNETVTLRFTAWGLQCHTVKFVLHEKFQWWFLHCHTVLSSPWEVAILGVRVVVGRVRVRVSDSNPKFLSHPLSHLPLFRVEIQIFS